jgi:hypothetical protein
LLSIFLNCFRIMLIFSSILSRMSWKSFFMVVVWSSTRCIEFSKVTTNCTRYSRNMFGTWPKVWSVLLGSSRILLHQM